MLRVDVLDELRHVLRDTRTPYRWSDRRLMRFLAMGQDQFCKDTGFFTDRNSYTITTQAGIDQYDIDSRIIRVYEVWYGDNVRLTQFFEHQRSSEALDQWSNSFSTIELTPGPPYGWQTDRETQKLTLYPIPDTVYEFDLRVQRRSLVVFDHQDVNGKFDTELEIPEDHHFAPIEYAAWRAFSDHDSELQDPVKAAEHFGNYKMYAKEGKRDFRRLSGGGPTFAGNPLYVV
jgi:hypothetical protein